MQKKQTKPILRVYGRKPRASKTSKRIHFKGFDFFLHRSKAETGGHVMIYWDKAPYPYIKLLVFNDGDIIEDKASEWIDKNLDEIIDKLQTLKNYSQVPKEFLSKMGKSNDNDYEIIDDMNRKPNMQLISIKQDDNSYLYLWCDPIKAPTKPLKGKQVLDKEEIYKEYIKRKDKV